MYKSEQLFDIDNTMEGAKVKLASIHFEGKTLFSFQSFLRTGVRGKPMLWSEFVEALLEMFWRATIS